MATKKDYFKDAQVGKINKVALNNFFDQSPFYEIELTKIEHKTGKYEGKFNGKVQIMSYSKKFEDRVLEFMEKIDNKVDNIEKDIKNIKSDITGIKSRLDKIENRLDTIESLPTIQKELKKKK